MRHASTSIPVKSRVEVQVNSRFSPASTATGKGKLHHTIPRKWHDILLQSRNATGKYLLVSHQSCTNRWCKDAASFYEIFVPSPSTQKVEIRMNSKYSQKKSDHRYLASWQILQMLHWVNKPIAWQNKTVTVWAVRWKIEGGGGIMSIGSENDKLQSNPKQNWGHVTHSFVPLEQMHKKNPRRKTQ